MSVESLLGRAEKYLQTAAILLKTGDYASSISRSFYAMLFATRAALRTRELDPSTHKGVFTLFNEHFLARSHAPAWERILGQKPFDIRISIFEFRISTTPDPAPRAAGPRPSSRCPSAG